MAGRGRGRGRGTLTFDISALGIGRGEAVPSAVLQPPPLYPPLEFRPSPLSNTEVDNYLLVLKQELRGAIRESPYFIKPKVLKKDIERHSDQYKKTKSDSVEWTPDWNFFPKELKPSTSKRKAKHVKGIAPKILKREPVRTVSDEKVIKEKLENIEKTATEKEKSDDEEDDEGGEEEVEMDDEDEDDNDYNFDYDDDGGDTYGQGDDDGDEGPVY